MLTSFFSVVLCFCLFSVVKQEIIVGNKDGQPFSDTYIWGRNL